MIQPASALPDITQPLSIVATGQQIVLDGASAGDGVVGLSFVADGARVEGLTVQGFGGHGIFSAAADTVLSSVTSKDNCGWGVWAEGNLRIDDASGMPSEVSNNGATDACEAGGVYVGRAPAGSPGSTKVRLKGVTLTANDGPGLFSLGDVVIEGSRISDNAGEGIAAYPQAGSGVSSSADYVRFDPGETEVSGNGSHGIYVDTGKVEAVYGARLMIRDNAGWGIWAAIGEVVLGEEFLGSMTPDPHELMRNGGGGTCQSWSPGDAGPQRAAEPCRGGAILAVSNSASRHVFVENALLADNAGPGVLTTMRIRLGGAVIVRDNRGQGLVSVGLTGFALPSIGVDVREPGLSVTGNSGDGIESSSGSVQVAALIGFDVSDNDGYGVRAEADVTMEASSGTTPTRVISGNGGGVTCERWSIDETDETSTVTSVACDGGGLTSEVNVDAHDLVSRDNIGPGVYAAGDSALTDCTVCNNTGTDIDAGGGSTLTRVSTTCP